MAAYSDYRGSSYYGSYPRSESRKRGAPYDASGYHEGHNRSRNRWRTIKREWSNTPAIDRHTAAEYHAKVASASESDAPPTPTDQHAATDHHEKVASAPETVTSLTPIDQHTTTVHHATGCSMSELDAPPTSASGKIDASAMRQLCEILVDADSSKVRPHLQALAKSMVSEATGGEEFKTIESKATKMLCTIVQWLVVVTPNDSNGNVYAGKDVYLAYGAGLRKFLEANVLDPKARNYIVEGLTGDNGDLGGSSHMSANYPTPEHSSHGASQLSRYRNSSQPAARHRSTGSADPIGISDNSVQQSHDSNSPTRLAAERLHGKLVARGAYVSFKSNSLGSEASVIQVCSPKINPKQKKVAYFPTGNQTMLASLSSDELHQACVRVFGTVCGYVRVENLGSDTPGEQIWVVWFETTAQARAALKMTISVREVKIRAEQWNSKRSKVFHACYQTPPGPRSHELKTAIEREVPAAFPAQPGDSPVKIRSICPADGAGWSDFYVEFPRPPNLLQFYVNVQLTGLPGPLMVPFRRHYSAIPCSRCGKSHQPGECQSTDDSPQPAT